MQYRIYDRVISKIFSFFFIFYDFKSTPYLQKEFNNLIKLESSSSVLWFLWPHIFFNFSLSTHFTMNSSSNTEHYIGIVQIWCNKFAEVLGLGWDKSISRSWLELCQNFNSLTGTFTKLSSKPGDKEAQTSCKEIKENVYPAWTI